MEVSDDEEHLSSSFYFRDPLFKSLDNFVVSAGDQTQRPVHAGHFQPRVHSLQLNSHNCDGKLEPLHEQTAAPFLLCSALKRTAFPGFPAAAAGFWCVPEDHQRGQCQEVRECEERRSWGGFLGPPFGSGWV